MLTHTQIFLSNGKKEGRIELQPFTEKENPSIWLLYLRKEPLQIHFKKVQDPEGWDGEGGGWGIQDGENM